MPPSNKLIEILSLPLLLDKRSRPALSRYIFLQTFERGAAQEIVRK